MGKILIPGQNVPQSMGWIDPKNPLQPQQVTATPIYQDAKYTVLIHQDGLMQKDVLNLPLELLNLAINLIDADKYVPIIGKAAFINTMRKLKRDFSKACTVQLAKARNIVDKKEDGNA